MNGKKLDTTCTAVKQATSLNCQSQGISNITGIQYFTSLQFLTCNSNSISTLPDFSGLKYLLDFDCSNNQLTSLGNATAVNFTCSNNPLTPVVTIPPGIQAFYCENITNMNYLEAQDDPELTNLDCSNNTGGNSGHFVSITGLPATLVALACSRCPGLYIFDAQLPASLLTFSCNDDSSINSLLPLPSGLTSLSCSNCGFSTLPTFPTRLNYLYCDSNKLTSLPALPASLHYLNCDYNNIASLPSLPDSLITLSCNYDSLGTLPVLPPGINFLECEGNMLHALPVLPARLLTLYCGYNPLMSLPALPPNLNTLSCVSDYIPVLPTLPAALGALDCYGDTTLTVLPSLPPHLSDFQCQYCGLTSLPELPDTMSRLDIRFISNLTCLPQLKYIEQLYFQGTPVTCLPDYPVGLLFSDVNLNTIPLCGIFNPSSCRVYWNISGLVYDDANADCLFDSTDAAQSNVKIQLYNNGTLVQQTYSSQGGFSFQTPQGNFIVVIDTSNLPFTVSCNAAALYDTITATDSLSYGNNFALQCRTQGFDIGVQSVLNNYITPRPGAVFGLSTIAGDISQLYGAHCATGISGQVQLTFSGPVTYAGTAAGALATSSVSGNTVIWNISDFGTVNDYNSFNTIFQIDSHAIAGTPICYTVSVSPTAGDFNPSNNTLTYCFAVANALDPNEKEVYPTTVDSAGAWLTYTIRFQNTGTAPAVNIIVKDTLDPSLVPATFQLLAYSAPNMTQLFGNVINFNFPNINLPDSTTSDSLSRGFVQYKIQLKTQVSSGTQIQNTASIYFDLNAPVVTNTVTDTLSSQTCTPTTSSLTQIICSGDTFYIGNTAYYRQGNYADTLLNTGGCDSTISLVLTVNNPDTTYLFDTICPGISISFNGNNISAAGIYAANYNAVSACDSVVILQLNFTPVIISDTTLVNTCYDSVLYNNKYYRYQGTYTDTFTSAGGCDSLVEIHITGGDYNTIIYDTICKGEPYYYHRTLLDSSGFYPWLFYSSATPQCDSFVQLHLTFTARDTVYLYDTICPGTNGQFNGYIADTAGIYVATYNATSTCDSTVIFQLTINTDSSACKPTIYPGYWPLLDSVNIWQYQVQPLFETPPPHNNNPGIRGLTNACRYPTGGFIQYFNKEEYTSGDTIINNIQYKQLWSLYPPNSCLAGFIREDTMARKVYFLDNLGNPEILLYSFSMAVGESIILGIIDNYSVPQASLYRLDSIKNIQLISGSHRKFYLNCDSCPYYLHQISWIEGVGSQVEAIYPYYAGGGGGNYYDECYMYANQDNGYPYTNYQFLNCFSHSQKVYFDSCTYAVALSNPPCYHVVDSCNYSPTCVGAINPISALNSFTVYPNPANNDITLSFDVTQSDVFEIEILDMQGRQTQAIYNTGRLGLGAQTRQLDIATLASGFYLVAVKNEQGIMYRKLVVSK